MPLCKRATDILKWQLNAIPESWQSQFKETLILCCFHRVNRIVAFLGNSSKKLNHQKCFYYLVKTFDFSGKIITAYL